MDGAEAEIGKVQREIDQVTAEARTAAVQGRDEDARRLYKEKEQLRTEKEQLRKEKEQLREEKLIALRAAGKQFHLNIEIANQGIESIKTPWLLRCLQLLLPHAEGCCACLEAKLCCQSCHAMMLCHSHIRQGINDTDHGHVHDDRLHMMQLQPSSAAALTYA